MVRVKGLTRGGIFFFFGGGGGGGGNGGRDDLRGPHVIPCENFMYDFFSLSGVILESA